MKKLVALNDGKYIKKRFSRDYLIDTEDINLKNLVEFKEFINNFNFFPLENLFFDLVYKLSDLFILAKKVNLLLDVNLDNLYFDKFSRIFIKPNIGIEDINYIDVVFNLLNTIINNYFQGYKFSNEFLNFYNIKDLRNLHIYSKKFLNSKFLIELGFSTDIGRVREIDEDSILISNKVIYYKGNGYTYGLYAISDGMGGHKAGEEASFRVLHLLDLYIWKSLFKLLKDKSNLNSIKIYKILKDVVFSINREIIKWGKENYSSYRTPGATLVAILNIYNLIFIINVGDSRIYLYREGKLKQLTKDHSVVQMLIDSGDLTKEKAKGHPASNMITSYIGIDNLTRYQIDIYQVLPGDIFLLNCDGLTDMVQEDYIQNILSYNLDLSMQKIVDLLITKANYYGGKDNISIVGVKFVKS